MITVKINHKEETVTYSTFINVGDRIISLTRTTLLYYAKPHHLDHSLPLPKDKNGQVTSPPLFEDLFDWPREAYENPELHHIANFRLSQEVENNDEARERAATLYNRKPFVPYFNYSEKQYDYSMKPYQMYWHEVIVSFRPDNKYALMLSNIRGDWDLKAVPANGGETRRIDCIDPSGTYHYDCDTKKVQGIFIVLEPREEKTFICCNKIQ